MKKFTLLVSLLLCTAGVTAQVSQKSIRTRLKAPKSVVVGKISAQQLKKKISGKRKTAAALPIWMPESEKFYIYEDGEWLLMANSTLTYDKAGNPLTVTMDEDGWLTRNTYTYDSNNMMISDIEENDESGSGEEWLYSTKTTKTYDPVVTDFITSTMEYKWDDVESNWGPGDKQSRKYEVTRDEKVELLPWKFPLISAIRTAGTLSRVSTLRMTLQPARLSLIPIVRPTNMIRIPKKRFWALRRFIRI